MRLLTKLALTLPMVLTLSAQSFSRTENLAPNIPSPQEVVNSMLEAAHVKPGETLYDLGCGDGRIIFTAAQKFKAKAVGVELDTEIYRRTQAKVKAMGLETQVRVIHGNLLKVDLRDADVVTLYLLTSSNDRLKPNLEKYLKTGSRVVSNDYPIPGWAAAQIVKTMAGGVTHNIYVYEMGSHKARPQ